MENLFSAKPGAFPYFLEKNQFFIADFSYFPFLTHFIHQKLKFYSCIYKVFAV